MRADAIPRHVAAVIAVAVLACLGCFALAIGAVRDRVDAGAATESKRLMAARLDDLRAALATVTRDYNHWSDAHLAMAARDPSWIAENYAITATTGTLFDGLVLLDGPIGAPLGWQKGSPSEPGPSFLPSDLPDRVPSRVEVELTESVVVDDPVLAALRLREMHAAGFSTALDDFGTGYSSIGYLDQLSFDTVEIDRSFVSGQRASGERRALVSAMISLGHALGLRVVCGGVEQGADIGSLTWLGCDLLQGFHLDRPLGIDDLAARWLRVPAGHAAA